MALKARFCHLTKNQKDRKSKSPKKSYIEPLIYEYLSTYFNELIQYVMEEEELTWNDDEWFPNEEL